MDRMKFEQVDELIKKQTVPEWVSWVGNNDNGHVSGDHMAAILCKFRLLLLDITQTDFTIFHPKKNEVAETCSNENSSGDSNTGQNNKVEQSSDISCPAFRPFY